MDASYKKAIMTKLSCQEFSENQQRDKIASLLIVIHNIQKWAFVTTYCFHTLSSSTVFSVCSGWKILAWGLPHFLLMLLICGGQSASCTSLQSYTAHFTRGEVIELPLCSKSQKSFLSLTSNAFAHSFYSSYAGLGMTARYNWEKIVRIPAGKARMLWLYSFSEVFITICGIHCMAQLVLISHTRAILARLQL